MFEAQRQTEIQLKTSAFGTVTDYECDAKLNICQLCTDEEPQWCHDNTESVGQTGTLASPKVIYTEKEKEVNKGDNSLRPNPFHPVCCSSQFH